MYLCENIILTYMKRTVIAFWGALLTSAACLAQADFDIDSLMAKMTLEEKIGQMNQLTGNKSTGINKNTGRNEKIRSVCSMYEVTEHVNFSVLQWRKAAWAFLWFLVWM